MKYIAVLGSTNGSSLQPVIDAIKNSMLNAKIDIVISNKRNSGILQRAARYNIPHKYICPESDIISELKKHALDVIILVGWMKILSRNFILHWSNKIINVHPSLLPNFAGMINLAVHKAVLAKKHKYSGCSVHIVTEEVDNGKILLQKQCAVLPNDTAESLKKRVQDLEGPALIQAIEENF